MTLSEDEIDDILYLARTGERNDLGKLSSDLCERENVCLDELLQSVTDQHNGNGVFHMAAANGFSDLIGQLCKSLSNTLPQRKATLSILNAQNLAGNTALHWAALNGHLETVKVLIEQGADPTIRNNRGHDAIYEAELNNKTEIVEWVLREGGEGLEEGLGEDNIKKVVDEGLPDISSSEELNTNLEQMNININ